LTLSCRQLRSAIALIVTPIAVGLATPAAAAGPAETITAPRPASPFELSLAADLQITTMAMVMGFGASLFDGTGSRPVGALSRSELNDLDRGVVGNHSGKAAALSDIGLFLGASVPLVGSALDLWLTDPRDGYDGLLKDSLIMLQTMAINRTLCNLVKFMARRPRPYTYDPRTSAELRSERGATLSFYSGHTSTAFSMATAYSYLFSLRHPNSRFAIPVWLGSHALASMVAVSRVLAGKHFWTDVAVGAAVGSAIGFAVPYLHREPSAQRWWADLRLVPTFHEGGFGVGVIKFW